MAELNEKKDYPLVLVFYIDRDTMKNEQITQAFADSVNELIKIKNFNALAFFIPTDEKERIDCLNPTIASPEQMERVDKLINDISNSFGIGEELNDVLTQTDENILN